MAETETATGIQCSCLVGALPEAHDVRCDPLCPELWFTLSHKMIQIDHHLGYRQNVKARKKQTILSWSSSRSGRRALQRCSRTVPTPASQQQQQRRRGVGARGGVPMISESTEEAPAQAVGRHPATVLAERFETQSTIANDGSL